MSRFGFRTRSGQISAIIQGQSAASTDADAQAFFDRVTAAGGTLSQTEKDAVNTLVLNLKANSLWTLMTSIYPMVGASAAACAQNLISSSFTATFSSGWTFSSTGVTPNGTSAFMNTNVVPNTNLLLDSTHMSLYSRTNQTTVASIVDMGCEVTSKIYLITKTGGSTYISVNTNTDTLVSTITDTSGFFAVSRTSSSLTKMYKNNAVHATSTVTSTSRNAQAIYLGAYNLSGTERYFSNKQYAFCSIGFGLDDTQESNFYTAIQAFQTSLSRQI